MSMSQAEITITHIVKYGSISSKQAYGLYEITRLSAVIAYLKTFGFEFKRSLIEEGVPHKQGRKPVAYHLVTEQREAAKEMLEYKRLQRKLNPENAA